MSSRKKKRRYNRDKPEEILYLCINRYTGELLYSGLIKEEAYETDMKNLNDTIFICFNLDFYKEFGMITDNELIEMIPDNEFTNSSKIIKLIKQQLYKYIGTMQENINLNNDIIQEYGEDLPIV